MRRDMIVLFITRYLRLLGFGAISVVIPLYLGALGYGVAQTGLLLTLTLAGDLLISLPIMTFADRIGRRKMLLLGGLLMFTAGIVFIATGNFVLLVLAATIGIVSPSGNEIGPFLAIEQASLSEITHKDKRTAVFAWYNLAGSFATGIGALAAGWSAEALRHNGISPVDSYKLVIGAYTAIAILQSVLFAFLTRDIEVGKNPAANPGKAVSSGQASKVTASSTTSPASAATPGATAPDAAQQGVSAGRAGTSAKWFRRLGLETSGPIVMKLSALFGMDAFAGGFVVSGMLVAWFTQRYGLDSGVLGSILFGANVLAGISALLTVPLSKRIGLVNTMVFTHLPSNVLLILVPLMPDLGFAIVMLFLRFSISQMDVPTRQAYVMSVVPPGERSAAAGFTGVARSVGALLSPGLSGLMITSVALSSLPFLLSGGIKIVYDLLLFSSFRKTQGHQ